ncbi:MAG: hypothetical protein ISS19_18635 [Bacteroidales bacterium]|nr:hypothetical protein [Bacteroidales bacterium]
MSEIILQQTRARKMQEAAKTIHEHHNGMFPGNYDDLYDKFLSGDTWSNWKSSYC